jgi:protein O-GlcNAc transferase
MSKTKKIISFSLWGEDEKYTIGALRNVQIARKLFPDWICRFYLGTSVPEYIKESLKNSKNTEVIEMKEAGDWSGMFWRFLPCSEEDVEVMISRDTDSRLGKREKCAIDEWMESDKNFHIMRDHPWHGTEILGGMWGAKRGVLNQMKTLMEDYEKGDFWQVDQNFLKEKVYSLVVNDSVVHDEFFNYENFKKPFPCKRENFEFVGEIFNEVEEFVPENRDVIRQYLSNPVQR